MRRSSAAKYTVLQMAIMMNKKKVVEYLLPQQDLDLNTKATDGTTALMTAVDQGVSKCALWGLRLKTFGDEGLQVDSDESQDANDSYFSAHVCGYVCV